MSTKKCACFTPSGLVYTRLETDGTIARRPVDNGNITRSRRSIDNDVFEPNTVDTILQENPSIGHLSFNNEPINELDNIEASNKIDRLIEETEAFLEAYERTKEKIEHTRVKRRAQHWNHNKHKHKNDAIINSNESSLECKVEKNGRVNCSQVIYNDLKAWHTNRLSLEDQIRQLRTKLEDLKEIKRHLKTTKPIVEIQTTPPTFINNHLFHKNITYDHNASKEHFRKNRIHRLKPKHRNSTTIDKRIRQFNEYVIPTVNAKTKEDVFDMQLKNVTRTEATTPNVNKDENKTSSELPKPQITTVVIERNYFHHNNAKHKQPPSSTTTTETASTTDFERETLTTKQPQIDTTTEQLTTEYFAKNVNYFSTSIDKVISTEKSTTKVVADITSTITPSEPTDKLTTSEPPLLGPARLDASEFEQRNSNVVKNMGVFTKPRDVFQRRLHPLFIQNEDKHVCYCEEGR